MKTQLLILAALLALGGCTGKNVQTVQDQPSGNHNFTLGQILKNRSFCDGQWSEDKNRAGDTLVQYSCSSTLDKEVIEAVKAKLRQQVQASVHHETAQVADEDRIATNWTGDIQKSLSYETQNNVDGKMDGFIARDKLILQQREQQQQRWAPMKADFLAKIQAKSSADLAAIDQLYTSPMKVEQKVFFTVDGQDASIAGFEYLMNGKKVNDAPYAPKLLVFQSELSTPKDASTATEWEQWWAAHLGFSPSVWKEEDDLTLNIDKWYAD